MNMGDTWMPFWRAYLLCHFTSRSRSGMEGLGQFYTAVALDPPDDVVGRRSKVRPTAMAIEFKFLAMRGYRRHGGFRRRLAAFEGRGGEDTAHDHTRVHVPRLRLKT